MLTLYQQQIIRKYSWWKSAGTPVRTFCIAALYYDLDDENFINFSSVGLLEFGYDAPDPMPVEKFVRLWEDGKLLPVNLFPNYKPGNTKG